MPRNMPDLPIRLRPWFVLFTALVMAILALLGFTKVAQEWPLNDKVLHFVCFGAATGVFYFIFDVDEDARRIWFWRYFGVIATGLICFFFGGIMSEIVQGLLPYKTFDFGDVLANLLGSCVGLTVSYYFERYYRRRREIARLYKPINEDVEEAGYTDDEDALGAAGLPYPSRYSNVPPTPNPFAVTDQTKLVAQGGVRPQVPQPPIHKNVWDDRMELFDVGDDDDDDNQRPLRGGSKV